MEGACLICAERDSFVQLAVVELPPTGLLATAARDFRVKRRGKIQQYCIN
jgi:hypothetical protein